MRNIRNVAYRGFARDLCCYKCTELTDKKAVTPTTACGSPGLQSSKPMLLVLKYTCVGQVKFFG